MADGDDGDKVISEAAAALVHQATGLPEPIARGLLPAVSRLLGGLTGYPAALLHRLTQGVEDGTAARSQMTAELAKAATQQAVSDPRIVERTMWSMLGEGVRKQVNREEVAKAAVAESARRAAAGAAEQTAPPEDDWMNVFSRYAEDASSERLRDLWGRVLAGEVHKPGAFSLTTLRFISELDKRTAEDFLAFSREVFAGSFAPVTEVQLRGERFRLISRLETAGLITGLDGNRIQNFEIPDAGTFTMILGTVLFQITAPAGTKFTPSVYLLTDLGQELLTLLPPNENRQAVEDWLKKELGKPPTIRLSVADLIDGPDSSGTVRHGPSKELWSAPGVT